MAAVRQPEFRGSYLISKMSRRVKLNPVPKELTVCKPTQGPPSTEALEVKPVGITAYVVVVQSIASDSLQPHGLQHNRLPCPSPSIRVCLSSCPLSQ